MSFQGMLDHKCDIYHLIRTDISPGYNLPDSPVFNYPDMPDIAGVACHFGIRGGTITVVQAEPQANYEARIKLSLPAGTDIRINDKVIDCATGYEYTAEIPLNIRGHHKSVILHRTSQQEPL